MPCVMALIPSEAGGRIDADIWQREGRCVIRVTDTGVGLKCRDAWAGHGAFYVA